MLWSEIKGQQKTKNNFLKFYQSGRMPHAILVLGKEGYGGLPLAVGYAQYLLCENKIDGIAACGECKACIKTKNFVHPDLHFTFPSFPPNAKTKTNSKHFIGAFRTFLHENAFGSTSDWLQSIGAGDKQSGNISSEECREMIERLSLMAMEGDYKIQIIWRPEYLGKEGNILLKLIEEPPKDTIFLLVAEETEEILETILSRTQLVRVPPFTQTEVQQILIDTYKIPAEQSLQASLLSEGSVTKALTVVADTDTDLLEFLKEWFNGVFTFNGNSIGKWVDTASKMPVVQLKNFLIYTQQLLGYSFKLSMIPSYQAPLGTNDLQFVQKLAQRKFSSDTIKEMDKLINEAVYHIERNANVKVVLLHLSVMLQYAIKGQKLTS